MLKIYDDPELPNEGACLRYMLNWNRQMRGHVEEMYASKKNEARPRAGGMLSGPAPEGSPPSIGTFQPRSQDFHAWPEGLKGFPCCWTDKMLFPCIGGIPEANGGRNWNACYLALSILPTKQMCFFWIPKIFFASFKITFLMRLKEQFFLMPHPGFSCWRFQEWLLRKQAL